MTYTKIYTAIIISLVWLQPAFSQAKDSANDIPAVSVFSATPKFDERKPFPVKSFILPAMAVAYGFAAIESNGLKSLNNSVKEEVWLEKPHAKNNLDDYLQWTPTVAVYGLNLAGIHGKNNFRDRTMIYLMSQLFMNTTVLSLKYVMHQQRPDGSDYHSFPSGHTANAFVGAEFMWQEYKDVSPLLGASGYVMAATTGYLRMHNNKHWLSDVVAGAGIGIASTKLAYWLYPKLQHKFFKNSSPNTVIMPYYQKNTFGISLVKQF